MKSSIFGHFNLNLVIVVWGSRESWDSRHKPIVLEVEIQVEVEALGVIIVFTLPIFFIFDLMYFFQKTHFNTSLYSIQLVYLKNDMYVYVLCIYIFFIYYLHIILIFKPYMQLSWILVEGGQWLLL